MIAYVLTLVNTFVSVPKMGWSAKEAEWLVRVLFGIGGVLATIVGSWITSKIRVYHDNRKAHLEDLKEQVLKPMRRGLDEKFREVISGEQPIVFVVRGAREVFEKARVTEPQAVEEEYLATAFPNLGLFAGVDWALLRDASKNHFRKLRQQADNFLRECRVYADECESWSRKMADAILAESCLGAFPKWGAGPNEHCYVMHNRLAIFVFKRLFGISAPALRVAAAVNNYWGLHGENATLAVGERQQIEKLEEILNRFLESEADHATVLRSKLTKLQESSMALSAELDLAIASRRLRKRCDLVPFF
jgi:hypothetical protein